MAFMPHPTADRTIAAARRGLPAALLIGALALMLALVATAPAQAAQAAQAADDAADTGLIGPRDALARAQTGRLTIIDIRRRDEWRQTGLPAGAARATVRFAHGGADFLQRIRQITDGDKSRPIALICARGVRSSRAAALLRRHGYSAVHDIGQGMLGSGDGIGWLGLDLPVAPCPDC